MGDDQALMDMMGTGTVAEAMARVAKIDGQLLFVAIAVPVALIVIDVLARKFGKTQFSSVQMVAMTMAGLWMVMGYYVAEALMVGSFVIPILAMPWNVVQFVVGMMIAYALYVPLSKMDL